MDLQYYLVFLVALAAAAYLGRTVWKTWTASGCGGGCGCAVKAKDGEAAPKLIAADELLVRARSAKQRERR